MHVPASIAVTVLPAIAQTEALDWATATATGKPDVAAAVTVYEVEPAVALPGGVEMKLTACGARSTGNDCCTVGAARLSPSPACCAVTVHVPSPTNATTEPLTVQIPALLDAAAKLTARPELAVAETE